MHLDLERLNITTENMLIFSNIVTWRRLTLFALQILIACLYEFGAEHLEIMETF